MGKKNSIETRGLPANLDLERMVLGALMLQPNRWREISATITAGDFSIEKHRKIYGRMGDLADRGEVIDRVTLANELMHAGQLESVDGLSYVVSLDEGLPEIFHLESYAAELRELSLRRRALIGCASLQEQCASGEAATEIVSQLEHMARELTSELSTGDLMQTPGSVIDLAGASGVFGDGRSNFLSTPWPRLNQLIGGFEPGQAVVVGGRPGSGKSVFLCQCAYEAALAGKTVALFSLEMSSLSLIQRFISSRAGVPLHRVRSGSMDQEQRALAQASLFEISEISTLRLGDKLYTMPAIRAAAAKLSSDRKLDLIVIDYLQLLVSGQQRSLVEEVTQISRAVKLLAVEFGVPVLVGSQLSRESEKENREPRLSDLRNSGSLEQDADTVIFPHPVKIQDPDSQYTAVEFIVAKQRNGRTGRVPITFERPYVRFTEA